MISLNLSAPATASSSDCDYSGKNLSLLIQPTLRATSGHIVHGPETAYAYAGENLSSLTKSQIAKLNEPMNSPVVGEPCIFFAVPPMSILDLRALGLFGSQSSSEWVREGRRDGNGCRHSYDFATHAGDWEWWAICNSNLHLPNVPMSWISRGDETASFRNPAIKFESRENEALKERKWAQLPSALVLGYAAAIHFRETGEELFGGRAYSSDAYIDSFGRSARVLVSIDSGKVVFSGLSDEIPDPHAQVVVVYSQAVLCGSKQKN